MLGSIRSYLGQVWAAMRVSAADRVDFAVQVAGMVVNNGFVLTLWFMFFQGFKTIGGWKMADMALLVGILTSVVGIAGVAFGGYRDMAATILRGEPDALLTQPKSVYWRLLSRESIVTAWGDVITSVVLLSAFAGLTPAQVPLAVLMVGSGVVIYVGVTTTFASLAFWARGARSFARDLTDFVIMFASYPGSIYSGASKLVVYTLLPAGFIVLIPVALLRSPDFGRAAILAVATMAYGALSLGVFHLGLARYQRGESPIATV